MIYSASEINLLSNIIVAVGFFLAGCLFVYGLKGHDRSTLIKIFSCAFFLRLATAFSLYIYLIAIGGDGFAFKDDRKYDRIASAISQELGRGGEAYFGRDSGEPNVGYFNFNGWLYNTFNFDTMSSRLVNVLLSSITTVIFYLIFANLFDYRRAAILGYTLALFPNFIFWSSVQFKDVAIIFFSAVLVHCIVCRFRERFSLSALFVFFISIFSLWHLRRDYCFPYIGVVSLILLMKFTGLETVLNNPRKSLMPKAIIITAFATSIIVGMSFTSTGSEFVEKMGGFNESQAELAGSNSGFSRYLRIVSVVDIYKLPAAMAFTAIAPLPSFAYLSDPTRAGASIYSAVNLGLVLGLPFVVAGFFMFRGERLLFTDMLLLRWIPLMMLGALSVFYMGNLRYKSALLVYFACWATLAIADRKEIKGKLLATYGAILFAIAFIVPIASIFR